MSKEKIKQIKPEERPKKKLIGEKARFDLNSENSSGSDHNISSTPQIKKPAQLQASNQKAGADTL